MFNLDVRYPFISNTESNKLRLLEMLLQNGKLQIDEISKSLDTSYRSTRYLINELISDILDHNTSVKIADASKWVSIEHLDSLEYLNLFISIKIKYYETSIPFNILMYLLNKKNCSVYKLSTLFNISHSYVYKIIKDLNKELDIKNFHFFLNVKKNLVYIDGRESHIRISYYFFCIVVFDTHNSFLSPIYPENKNIYSDDFSLLTHYKINLINEIFYSRGLIHFINLEITNHENQFFKILSERIEKKIDPVAITNLDEKNCWSLWLAFCIPELVSDDDKIAIGKILNSNQSNSKTIKYLIGLIEHLSNHYTLSENMSCYSLLYEFFLTFLVYDILDYHIFKFPLSIKNNISSIPQDFKELISEYISEFITESYFNELLRDFTDSAYSFFDVTNPLFIYIEFSDYSRRKSLIENSIKKVYKESSVQIISNISNADLVISNSLPLDSIKDYFYFTGIDSEFNWYELGKAIQKSLIEKNMPIV